MSNTAGSAISILSGRGASSFDFSPPVSLTNGPSKSSARRASTASQIDLSSACEGGLDPLAELPHLVADVRIDDFAATAHLQQLVRDVQGRHHCDAIQADDIAVIANLTHLAVQVLRRVQELRALLRETCDLIFLFQDANADADHSIAHALCSIAFRRPIIASTRALTCSFFCRSVARSVIIESIR